MGAPFIETKAEFTKYDKVTLEELQQFVDATRDWPPHTKVDIRSYDSQHDGYSVKFSAVKG